MIKVLDNNQSFSNLNDNFIVPSHQIQISFIQSQQRMLPYKAPQIKIQSKTPKIKSLPTLEIATLLANLCENSSNKYDSANHILTVNDFQSLEKNLMIKHNRSIRSFEKQLKMLGFKSKKYKQLVRDDDGNGGKPEFYEARVYKWRGKKQILLNQQLTYFEKNLSDRKNDMEAARDKIKQTRKYIDEYLQLLMLSLLVNPDSSQAKISLNTLISQTRQFVNGCQVQMQQILNKSTNILGNELELYRLLIFKEQSQRKKQANNEDSPEQNNDDSMNSGYKQPNSKSDEEQNGEGSVPNMHGPIPEEDDSESQISMEDDGSKSVSIKMDQNQDMDQNEEISDR